MPRERKSRDWIKINCTALLNSSINYLLTLEERGAWIYLLAFSEVCGGRAGFIEDNEGRGLPRDYLAQSLHVPLEVLESMITKQIEDKAIKRNGTGVLELVNFPHYQFTEYDRQKPYRQARKAGAQIHKVCNACDYKGVTSEVYCPKCQGELKRDYHGGKYGHMVKK